MSIETENKSGWMPVKLFAKKKEVTIQAVYQAIKRGSYESKRTEGYPVMVRE